METILAEREHWQGMAAEIPRAYAEQTFKPETMVARHLALYRDLVEGRAGPAARRRAAWIDPAMPWRSRCTGAAAVPRPRDGR